MIPALEVAGLGHRFGKPTVLDDIGFTVLPGSFTVLLGPNGAAKTTLFALITRLYHATQGRIAVLGRDFRADPQAALARMGIVFQQSTLDLDLTVEQNLRYYAALHGMASAIFRPLIATALDRVGLLPLVGLPTQPFTSATEMIRFALCDQIDLISTADVAGCAIVFMAAAVTGYNSGRGFMARRGAGD